MGGGGTGERFFSGGDRAGLLNITPIRREPRGRSPRALECAGRPKAARRRHGCRRGTSAGRPHGCGPAPRGRGPAAGAGGEERAAAPPAAAPPTRGAGWARRLTDQSEVRAPGGRPPTSPPPGDEGRREAFGRGPRYSGEADCRPEARIAAGVARRLSYVPSASARLGGSQAALFRSGVRPGSVRVRPGLVVAARPVVAIRIRGRRRAGRRGGRRGTSRSAPGRCPRLRRGGSGARAGRLRGGADVGRAAIVHVASMQRVRRSSSGAVGTPSERKCADIGYFPSLRRVRLPESSI